MAREVVTQAEGFDEARQGSDEEKITEYLEQLCVIAGQSSRRRREAKQAQLIAAMREVGHVEADVMMSQQQSHAPANVWTTERDDGLYE